MKDRDAEQKMKMKANADQKLGVREGKIKLEDTVLIKQPKCNKLSPPFSPVPIVVEEKNGSMVTASDEKLSPELIHVQRCPEPH